MTRVATLTGLFFSAAPVTNYDDAQQADHQAYARFFHALLDRGVFLAPSGYETLFVSLAHTDDLIDQTVEAAARSWPPLTRRLRPRRVVVLGQPVPPHVVHEEQRPGDDRRSSPP